jgi:hypothetical protein
MKRTLAVLAIVAAAVMVRAADQYINVQPLVIKGSTNTVVAASIKPIYLTSVLMSLPVGGTNTFTVSCIRGSVTNVLMTVTATNMTDVVWFVPSRVYFTSGDNIVFSNTKTNAGTVTPNFEF